MAARLGAKRLRTWFTAVLPEGQRWGWPGTGALGTARYVTANRTTPVPNLMDYCIPNEQTHENQCDE
jgi:hypothetical protein